MDRSKEMLDIKDTDTVNIENTLYPLGIEHREQL